VTSDSNIFSDRCKGLHNERATSASCSSRFPLRSLKQSLSQHNPEVALSPHSVRFYAASERVGDYINSHDFDQPTLTLVFHSAFNALLSIRLKSGKFDNQCRHGVLIPSPLNRQYEAPRLPIFLHFTPPQACYLFNSHVLQFDCYVHELRTHTHQPICIEMG
jgi:hypothetical protein